MSEQTVPVKTVTLNLCQLCLNGAGRECHTPGCALFLHDSPGHPIMPELYEIHDDTGKVLLTKEELESKDAEIERLRKEVIRHREGVARFLVPWKHHVPDSWLDHFVEECGVEFDAIGFVKAKPIDQAGGKE